MSVTPAAAPENPTRHWGDTRSRSIWRWQLILTASAVTLIALVAVLDPDTFSRGPFLIGAVAIIVITCAALALPWHRIDRIGVAGLVLANIGAIGFLSQATGSRLGFLWVFPVAWVATYYTLPWLVAALSAIALILLIEGLNEGLTPIVTQQFLTVLLCLGFMGATINIGARRTRAYSHLLRRQFSQLDRTRDRALSQARRTSVLSNSLDTGLARIDRDGVLLDANAAFLRLFGAVDLASFTPTAAVEYDARRGAAVDPAQTAIARAARGEQFDDRVWLFTTDGSWHGLDVTSRPVPGTIDEAPSSVVIVHDVTAALDAELARRTVSTVVSHELRNPLTAILGHTDLLHDRVDLPPDVRRQLTVIDNAAQRMQRLVTSALDDFTVEAAATEVDVDVRAIIEASVQAFLPVAAAGQVQLTTGLGTLPGVRGDAFELRQAIDNVIGNAVKYTPRGAA